MSEENMKWYILQVYTTHENKVLSFIKERITSKNLEHLVEEIVLPVQDVTVIKNGKKVLMKKNFLPGYLLLKVDLTDELLHLIRDVPKVNNFLGATKNGTPNSVSKEEIDKILDRIRESADKGISVESRFDIGESVYIAEGPFSSFSGVIEEIDVERSKLKISVSIFGRLTPVELDFSQVEKR